MLHLHHLPPQLHLAVPNPGYPFLLITQLFLNGSGRGWLNFVLPTYHSFNDNLLAEPVRYSDVLTQRSRPKFLQYSIQIG